MAQSISMFIFGTPCFRFHVSMAPHCDGKRKSHAPAGSDHLMSIRNWNGKYHGFLWISSATNPLILVLWKQSLHWDVGWSQKWYLDTTHSLQHCASFELLHGAQQGSLITEVKHRDGSLIYLGTWGWVNIGPFHRAVSSFVFQSHPHLLTLRSFRRSTAWGGMEWKSRAVWKGMGAGPWG